ncbi:hypothetical protein NL676_007048 [Syzygium grande]|nr:hypothetical protein NL676_007048 [Syzygium grande]
MAACPCIVHGRYSVACIVHGSASLFMPVPFMAVPMRRSPPLVAWRCIVPVGRSWRKRRARASCPCAVHGGPSSFIAVRAVHRAADRSWRRAPMPFSRASFMAGIGAVRRAVHRSWRASCVLRFVALLEPCIVPAIVRGGVVRYAVPVDAFMAASPMRAVPVRRSWRACVPVPVRAWRTDPCAVPMRAVHGGVPVRAVPADRSLASIVPCIVPVARSWRARGSCRCAVHGERRSRPCETA